jgi:hypothetical protein
MNTTGIRRLFAAALCSGLLGAAGAAEAHNNGRWSPPGHSIGHYKHKHHGKPHQVVRERVIVRQAPRYRDRHVAHHYHYAYPPYPYAYGRSPSIVITVPPLVIPLR